jgi:hypothetical protein
MGAIHRTAMNRPLQIALIVGVFALAFGVFEHSENGHYQYSTNGDRGVIVDTRTGEYWDERGDHIEPRKAHITAHHPSVDDQTASDDRSNKFLDCIHDAEAHKKDIKDCGDLLPGGSQTATPARSSTPATAQ